MNTPEPAGRDEPGGKPGSEQNLVGRGAGGAEPRLASSAHRGNRRWWTTTAREYYEEHGAFLGDSELVWGPEGVRESELHLLGELAGKDVLEFGCGAAQGARWAAGAGARVVASDIAEGMLDVGRRIDRSQGVHTPMVQADAVALPFAEESFDVVFTAYGAVPFVADLPSLLRECARVLRPGGRVAYSTSHPVRWAFPDSPTALEATMDYFDRSPYMERTGDTVDYAEYHRTVGDHVRALAAAGLHLVDVAEPKWPQWNTQTWGGWSPLRGRHIPGTAIFVADKPGV